MVDRGPTKQTNKGSYSFSRTEHRTMRRNCLVYTKRKNNLICYFPVTRDARQARKALSKGYARRLWNRIKHKLNAYITYIHIQAQNII